MAKEGYYWCVDELHLDKTGTKKIYLPNKCMYVSMEKTITVSDDIYKGLPKFKSHRSFSEILAGMIKKKGNLETLEIGFGSRNIREKETLKAELKKVEEDFQKWI